ncbi:MAG: hypothetical protein R2827_08525 [Bdellovibrionales bacterium]
MEKTKLIESSLPESVDVIENDKQLTTSAVSELQLVNLMQKEVLQSGKLKNKKLQEQVQSLKSTVDNLEIKLKASKNDLNLLMSINKRLQREADGTYELRSRIESLLEKNRKAMHFKSISNDMKDQIKSYRDRITALENKNRLLHEKIDGLSRDKKEA